MAFSNITFSILTPMDRQSISDASSKSTEDRSNPSSPEAPQVPMEPTQAPNADADANQGHEYWCKYCAKMFDNKQALAGHQNTNKIQCAMEKSARELQALGSTDLHLGWAAPDPRNTVPQPRGHLKNLDLNLSLCSRPLFTDLSCFAAPRIGPGGGKDEQDEDDSGLDLSIKL